MDRSFYLVAQGKTFDPDLQETYLWAPKADKRGTALHHWKRVAEVRKGDFIFQYSKSAIRSIAEALEDGHPMENPFPDQEAWGETGYAVKVRQHVLEKPITKAGLLGQMKGLRRSLSDLSSPFNRVGGVNQGYLFEFNLEAAQIVRQLSQESFPEGLENMLQEAMPTAKDNSDSFSPAENSPENTLRHVHRYIQSKGFTFSLPDIHNFFLSLKTKPFVILAGISGTGKSKLPQLMLEALGRPGNCKILPVRPDWTDNSDLIGYVDLQGRFQPKAVTHIVLEARSRPEEPFFLVLDEMNLARVEYYFSDFLSIIESRRRDAAGNPVTHPLFSANSLERHEDREVYQGLGIPANLYLIGTVNMDETTHPFSRKVLDRANSIEMNTVNLQWPDFVAESVTPLEPPIDNRFFQTAFLSPLEMPEGDREELDEFIHWLSNLNTILERADLHFGYRVRDEMAYYLSLNRQYGLLTDREARDRQLMQKVLPRIQGSSRLIKEVLLGVLGALEGVQQAEAQDFTLESLRESLPAEADYQYPLATKKILFMLTRYENDGFTSYWL